MSAIDHTMTLAPVLDLTAADTLKQEFLSLLAGGGNLAIDASQVQRISSPCLQVLAAAVQGSARIINPSQAFDETAETLDLAAALGLRTPHV